MANHLHVNLKINGVENYENIRSFFIKVNGFYVSKYEKAEYVQLFMFRYVSSRMVKRMGW